MEDGFVEEDGQDLIAALANLRSDLYEVEIEAESGKCTLPSLGVKIDAVHKGTIDVEDDGGGIEDR